MITNEQWQQAQILERRAHTMEKSKAVDAYRNAYKQYFGYLGMEADQYMSIIVEIGCADVPALLFCYNFIGFVIEPMESSVLKEICELKHIPLIKDMAETCKIPECDEIWFFNVLQHVLNPDIVIERAKKAAKIIRFFEPINFGIDRKHLHNFTLDYFKKHFKNDVVKHYPTNTEAVDFHTHECAYGTWSADK